MSMVAPLSIIRMVSRSTRVILASSSIEYLYRIRSSQITAPKALASFQYTRLLSISASFSAASSSVSGLLSHAAEGLAYDFFGIVFFHIHQHHIHTSQRAGLSNFSLSTRLPSVDDEDGVRCPGTQTEADQAFRSHPLQSYFLKCFGACLFRFRNKIEK